MRRKPSQNVTVPATSMMRIGVQKPLHTARCDPAGPPRTSELVCIAGSLKVGGRSPGAACVGARGASVAVPTRSTDCGVRRRIPSYRVPPTPGKGNRRRRGPWDQVRSRWPLRGWQTGWPRRRWARHRNQRQVPVTRGQGPRPPGRSSPGRSWWPLRGRQEVRPQRRRVRRVPLRRPLRPRESGRVWPPADSTRGGVAPGRHRGIRPGLAIRTLRSPECGDDTPRPPSTRRDRLPGRPRPRAVLLGADRLAHRRRRPR